MDAGKENKMADKVHGIRYLVFDLDGTLVKLPIEWGKVLEEISHVIGYMPKSILPILRRFYGTQIYSRISDIIERYEEKALDRMQVLDDAPSILKVLARRYYIYIVTMQSGNIAKKIINILGVEGIPRKIISRNDAGSRIDQLRIVLRDINDYPNTVLFVGDKVLDMIAAFHLGVKSLMIVRDYFNSRITGTDDLLEDLETLGVKIIWSLRDLPKVIDSL